MSRSTVRAACLCLVTACFGDRDPALLADSTTPSRPARSDTSSPAASTPMPTPSTSARFSIALWPGEGIPVIEARRAHVILHAQPLISSEIVDSLVTRVGARITWDSTRYQTVEPGLIHVTSPLQVTGRDLGSVEHLSRERYQSTTLTQVADSMAPPATMAYLQDRAEGTCFVRVGARVIDADPCPALGQGNVRVERRPVTRWWIGVRGSGGRYGWVVVSDSTAQVVRREF